MRKLFLVICFSTSLVGSGSAYTQVSTQTLGTFGVFQSQALNVRAVPFFNRSLNRRFTAAALLPLTVIALTLQEGRLSAQDNNPKEFLNHVLADAGGVESFIRRYPELQQAIQRRGVTDSGTKEKITKAYILFLFFRDAGFSGLRVADDGVSMEDYFLAFGDAEFKKLGTMRYMLLPLARTQKKLAENMFRDIQADVHGGHLFQSQFIYAPSHQSISPLMVNLLFDYLSYFGISDDLHLVMDKTHCDLLLLFSIDASIHFLIDFGEGRNAFDRPLTETIPPTKDAIKNYKISVEHKYIIPAIATSPTAMSSFSELAKAFAEPFFGGQAAVLYQLPIAEQDILHQLKLWDEDLTSQKTKGGYLTHAFGPAITETAITPENVNQKITEVRSQLLERIS